MNNLSKNSNLIDNKPINAELLTISKLKILLSSLSIFILVSCNAGSRTSFRCPSASGIACMPVDRVHEMIQSGEVEQIENQLLCAGKKGCSYKDFKPELKINRIYEAQLKEPEDQLSIKIDNTLYIK